MFLFIFAMLFFFCQRYLDFGGEDFKSVWGENKTRLADYMLQLMSISRLLFIVTTNTSCLVLLVNLQIDTETLWQTFMTSLP